MTNKKIIFFDLDGTLLEGNSWKAFNRAFGPSEAEDAMLYDSYHRGSITYQEWIDRICSLLRERKRCTREAYAAFTRTLVPREDAADLIRECTAHGYGTAILSGALYSSAMAIASRIGIDEVFTTASLAFDADGLIMKIELHKSMSENPVRTITDEGLAKLSIFKEACARYGADPRETMHVGDGSNDIEIFKYTSRGIALGEHPVLGPLAWKQVRQLKEIIRFLD
jgi:HAD superfamily phosphoserine phosphatase-like hydrolase